jgi:hypothetical protein
MIFLPYSSNPSRGICVSEGSSSPKSVNNSLFECELQVLVREIEKITQVFAGAYTLARNLELLDHFPPRA